MTPLDIAREKLLSTACGLVGNRLNIEVSEPGPHDDASLEMHDEMLDQAVGEYYLARMDELEGTDPTPIPLVNPQEPLLGLATTRQLMVELKARSTVQTIGEHDKSYDKDVASDMDIFLSKCSLPFLDYRTVGS